VEKNPLLHTGTGRELNSVMENDAIWSVLPLVDRSRNRVSNTNCNLDSIQ